MSRGFNMWNYMTYHLVHDYFKAKKKKKTEIQNFEVKNYKAAQKAAEQMQVFGRFQCLIR